MWQFGARRAVVRREIRYKPNSRPERTSRLRVWGEWGKTELRGNMDHSIIFLVVVEEAIY